MSWPWKRQAGSKQCKLPGYARLYTAHQKASSWQRIYYLPKSARTNFYRREQLSPHDAYLCQNCTCKGYTNLCRLMQVGCRETKYENGSLKQEFDDGCSTMKYTNGDIRQSYSNGRLPVFSALWLKCLKQVLFKHLNEAKCTPGSKPTCGI